MLKPGTEFNTRNGRLRQIWRIENTQTNKTSKYNLSGSEVKAFKALGRIDDIILRANKRSATVIMMNKNGYKMELLCSFQVQDDLKRPNGTRYDIGGPEMFSCEWRSAASLTKIHKVDVPPSSHIRTGGTFGCSSEDCWNGLHITNAKILTTISSAARSMFRTRDLPLNGSRGWDKLTCNRLVCSWLET